MFAVIDFETTGLVDEKSTDFMRQPGIVQMGVLVLDKDFKEIGSLNTLINPEIAAGAWAPKAIETHGIQPAQVRDAPTYMAIHRQFSDLIRSSRYWVGYRTRFDRDVLWYQLMRYGLERNFPWPDQEIDVMRLATEHINAKGKRGALFNTLGAAYETVFGRGFEGAHDAMADVRATGELLAELGKGLF